MALACTVVIAGLPVVGNGTNPLLDQMSQGSLSAAPSGFEENKGQVRTTAGEPARFVRYRLSQGNTSIFLLGTGIAYQFNRMHYPEGYAELEKDRTRDPGKQEQLDALRSQVRLETYRMDMTLEGADPDPRVSAEGRSSDYTNYYTHDALDVHTYARIIYHDVYPGIDWVVYTTEKGIEHDFVVHPGADPAKIQLRFKDHEELYIDEKGRLIHGNRMGRFTEEKPVSLQDGEEVPTGFRLRGDRLTFALGDYDPARTLTIDPARIWGTYYGGTVNDEGTSCAVDPDGNVYLAGITASSSGIASGGHQNTYGDSDDAFLVKFDPAGNRLWATYYGGMNADFPGACAVDPDGNVYLAGSTKSYSGIASGGHQNTRGGERDAFLVKFNPAGTRLWGTYYGGTEPEFGLSCAVDLNGNVYLVGYTWSSSGIASGGHQNTYSGGGWSDAFLVKFDPAGSRLWGTYYGGTDIDGGLSCAVDPGGNVYLAGETESTSGIAIGGHQNTHSGGSADAFLVKFDADGTRLWGTYYGGTSEDRGEYCAVDSNGNVYLAGYTSSTSGIASSGHQDMHGGGIWDAFLVKFAPTGNRLWSTYYGGEGEDRGISCAVDPIDGVYLAGYTVSHYGIDSNGYQDAHGGSRDAFLVKLNPTGTRLWGTYYGGEEDDVGSYCAVDPVGNVYLAGFTRSPNGIASSGHQNTGGGYYDAFLVKFEDWNCPALEANVGDACDDGNAATVNDVITADCECVGEIPDGINDQDGRAGLSMGIYPSPTTGRFTVHVEGLPAACATAIITVVDTEGKLVREQEVALANGAVVHEMDLTGVASQGLYAVRVTAKGLHLVRRLCVAW